LFVIHPQCLWLLGNPLSI
ncbi:ATP synthase alpha/beta family, beta-barrel domain protein, partial [Chlamydia psittaci 08-2626_L3]